MDQETAALIEQLEAVYRRAIEQWKLNRDLKNHLTENYWSGYAAGVQVSLSLLGVYID